MPTYDYACKKCGSDFEVFHGMSETPKVKCPSCRSVRVQKQLGAGAGLLFKGSGFYITDYRSDSYKSAAKTDAGAAKSASTAKKKTPKKESARAASKTKSA